MDRDCDSVLIDDVHGGTGWAGRRYAARSDCAGEPLP